MPQKEFTPNECLPWFPENGFTLSCSVYLWRSTGLGCSKLVLWAINYKGISLWKPKVMNLKSIKYKNEVILKKFQVACFTDSKTTGNLWRLPPCCAMVSFENFGIDQAYGASTIVILPTLWYLMFWTITVRSHQFITYSSIWNYSIYVP